MISWLSGSTRATIWLTWRRFGRAIGLPKSRSGFANVVRKMHADSTASGHPFLMLGVCGKMTEILESAFPDTYHFKPDRDYADYIYDREKLANLPARSCSQSATIATNSSCFPTTSTVR